MANCYSSGDWQFVETAATLFPSEFFQHGVVIERSCRGLAIE